MEIRNKALFWIGGILLGAGAYFHFNGPWKDFGFIPMLLGVALIVTVVGKPEELE